MRSYTQIDRVRGWMNRESGSIASAFGSYARRAKQSTAAYAPHIETLADALGRSFLRTCRDEYNHGLAMIPVRKALRASLRKQDVEFDPGDEEIAALMSRNKLQFVTDLIASQRRAVAQALSQAADRGLGEAATARMVQSAIGLTDRQTAAVANYRDLLQAGSSAALDRELRDRRRDRTVQGAIERGEVLDQSTIDRMVDGYGERMRDYRARTIARTESHRIVNGARHAAWKKLRKSGKFKDGQFVRTWRTTIDGRERDSHNEMDGQQVVGLDTPFETPGGEELMYPGDPAGSAEEVIGCRCVVELEIQGEDASQED